MHYLLATVRGLICTPRMFPLHAMVPDVECKWPGGIRGRRVCDRSQNRESDRSRQGRLERGTSESWESPPALFGRYIGRTCILFSPILSHQKRDDRFGQDSLCSSMQHSNLLFERLSIAPFANFFIA